MTRQDRLQKRNDKIRSLFENLAKKNPQWRFNALINEVANTMYLAPRTVIAILKGEGNYTNKAKQKKPPTV